jgi:S-adenosylmethionine:tRNA ribosyltransferase-isomerase
VEPDRTTRPAAAATLHHQHAASAPTKRAIRPFLPGAPAPWLHPPPACISTTALLAQLAQRGVEVAWLTLHVGAGTFQPVRVHAVSRAPHARRALRDSARDRSPPLPARARAAARSSRSGRPACAPSKQRRRAASCAPGLPRPTSSSPRATRFRVVDRLITNFHLPKSTLLMLVSAFAGLDAIRGAYDHAIASATASSAMATPCC